jgi:hypothetical protein
MGTFIRGTGDSSQRCCGCGSRSNPCDSPTIATLVCRTASASKTKCGFEEFGTPSSPPKKYLVKSQSGGLTNTQDPLGPNEIIDSVSWSGNITYTRPACTYTDNRQVVVTHSEALGACSGTNTQTGVKGQADYLGSYGGTDPNGCYMLATDCSNSIPVGLQSCCSAGTVNTTTQTTFADISCPGYLGGTVTGSNVIVTLSSEYTTSDLETDVTNAIPAFSGSFSSGSCTGAFYDKTSDEFTITKRKMQYKFTFSSISGYSCFKITWNETFTPEGGGSSTSTAKSYLWNGTDTETPVYTIDVPVSQGTTTITNVVQSCSCV